MDKYGYVAYVQRQISPLLLYLVLFTALSTHAQSTRPGWAATPYADASGTGITFRVWAPHATNVHVGGTFNSWNSSSHPLASEGTSGIWSADITDAEVGDSYSYIINNTLWKQDPRAQLFDTSNTKNPEIMSTNGFNWGGATNPVRSMNEMIIYEMHAGTFFDLNTNDTIVGTLSNAVLELDYVASLGFNTIQLMPIHEYPGDTSWGYNPIYPHSVARPYGGPGGLKTFVKACHERGISVLLDVVHNHWGPKGDKWGLWQMDGWVTNASYGGLYFYNTTSLATTPWGVTRPDYSRQGVRDYILDSFTLFLDEYHVDGFRWDTPYHIARDNNNNVNPDGVSLIADIMAETRSNFPHVIHMGENAEFIPDFDGHWDHTPSKELGLELIKGNDSDRNMNDIAAFILPDPTVIHVRYSESHDLVGGLNSRTRIPSQIDPADPFSYNARKRSALGGILTFVSQSVPMAFQGQCMYETHHFSSRYPLIWEYTNTYKETVTLYKDVIALRTNINGVTRGLQGDETDIIHLDHADKVVAYRRGGPDERQDCMIIVNISSNALVDYEVAFPEGMWFTHFNSDDSSYGSDYSDDGSDRVFAPHNATYEARVNVAPYSALVLSKLQSELNLIDVVLDDSTDGNGDEIVSAGETVHEYPVIYNSSDTIFSNLVLTVESPHADVTILSNVVYLSEISPGETITNETCFVYATERSLACEKRLIFSVNIQEDSGFVVTSYFGRVSGLLIECITNAAPVVSNIVYGAWNDDVLSDNVRVEDPEGHEMYYELNYPADHGLFTLNTNSGEFTYLPVRGYTGWVEASVQVSDQCGSSVVAVIDMAVINPPDVDGDGLPDIWEFQHFGNPTNAMPLEHGDDDHVTNLQEYYADTDPMDSNSYLRLSSGSISDDKIELFWKAAGGVRYRLEQSTNLFLGFEEIPDVLTNEMINTQPGTQELIHRTEAIDDEQQYFRLRVIAE